ncbi:MAG: hypothetical protein II369_01165, partial [Clostridia bacterium]|nr:hypothetical protein [Clostridia bacterium]
LKSKLSTPAFSFAHVGPKEKAWQKENGREDVSPSADGDQGCAPSTCAHWRGGYGALTRGTHPPRVAKCAHARRVAIWKAKPFNPFLRPLSPLSYESFFRFMQKNDCNICPIVLQ